MHIRGFELEGSKDWTNPVNMLEIKAAVEARKRFVTLDGRRYSIKYNDKLQAAWIQNTRDFAPAGWFSYERLRQFDFERSSE